MIDNSLYKFLLHLGDNVHVLGHRLAEWCGHGPVLEQDIAINNIALDLIGQARMYYQYAAEIEGKGRTEDDIAFLRDNREFYNFLLVEQPNNDWAHTMIRQFAFDSWHYYFLQALSQGQDERLSGIAAKSLKEVAYHLKYSSEWTIRLGDGTDESHKRMQQAIDNLWRYTGELNLPTEVDKKMSHTIGFDLDSIKKLSEQKTAEILEEATLVLPSSIYMQTGGKSGIHTEYLGYILAEMQFMQRTYPGLEW